MSVMYSRSTLTGAPDATHKITIPGTKFQAWVVGEDAANKLAAKLAQTNVGKVGRRNIKAQPIITELETAK